MCIILSWILKIYQPKSCYFPGHPDSVNLFGCLQSAYQLTEQDSEEETDNMTQTHNAKAKDKNMKGNINENSLLKSQKHLYPKLHEGFKVMNPW